MQNISYKSEIHRADTRGLAEHGWLKSRHTFSFADYYHPQRMGFGTLRVINDDIVAPGMGFGTHPHRDMEIISIPLSGALHHKDSEGNEQTISRGEVQIMSAGTGVTHSEYNASKTDPVNFLQIWVLPEKLSITPRYDQMSFDALMTSSGGPKLTMIMSPLGTELPGVKVNQQAYFYLLDMPSIDAAQSTFEFSRQLLANGVYLFVIDGHLRVDGQELRSRDGMGVYPPKGDAAAGKMQIELISAEPAMVLIMEVPMG